MRRALSITASASILPPRDIPGAVLTNARLSELMGELRARTGCDFEPSSPQFPFERAGIRERGVLDRHLSSRDMAVAAGRAVLEAESLDPEEVRCVIVSSVTPDRTFPAMATSVHAALGCPARTLAFDVSIGCNGFLVALDLAARQLAAEPEGAAALVIAAETMIRTADATDRATVPLFGDGGGGVMLRRTAEERLYRGRVATLGAHGPRIAMSPSTAPELGVSRIVSREGRLGTAQDQAFTQSITLDGRRVFRDMVRAIPEFVHAYLDESRVRLADVDRFLFHQANARMIDAVTGPSGLSLQRERVFTNIATVGNTASASIPILLAEAARAGDLHRGELALLCGFGSGYSMGAQLLKW